MARPGAPTREEWVGISQTRTLSCSILPSLVFATKEHSTYAMPNAALPSRYSFPCFVRFFLLSCSLRESHGLPRAVSLAVARIRLRGQACPG